MADGSVVIIGGTSALGSAVAVHYAERGFPVVITGRDPQKAAAMATTLGGDVTALAFDLERPGSIRDALATVGSVRYLVLVSIDRLPNTIRDYDVDRATRLATQKLVGYAEVVHVLLDRLDADSAILMFGGVAMLRPYPGGTMVTTVNAGVVGLVRTMTVELTPIRVNSIHPGIVAETPFWTGKNLDAVLAGTATKRFVTTADIVDGVRFLLENPSANGIDLRLDGGWIGG